MKDTRANLKVLFEAEEAANRVIREAEEKRERMMAQACTDAHEKAEQFRREREQLLAEEEARSPNDFAELMAQAEATMRQNDAELARFKSDAAAFLVERVCAVPLALHPNLAPAHP